MGKIVTVEYVDDIDGVPVDAGSVDTVEFSYRGDSYSLILTADNGAQFDKDIARYIKAAKKAATREARDARKDSRPIPAQTAKLKARPRPTSRKTAAAVKTPGPERTRAIREWAMANGHNVSPRGRIAATVIKAYDAAH
ncbi:Lsr2 family protein [Mycobacterium sp. AT1]|nr:Lsr2 family protein [Mycobacterium sp. AT1]